MRVFCAGVAAFYFPLPNLNAQQYLNRITRRRGLKLKTSFILMTVLFIAELGVAQSR